MIDQIRSISSQECQGWVFKLNIKKNTYNEKTAIQSQRQPHTLLTKIKAKAVIKLQHHVLRFRIKDAGLFEPSTNKYFIPLTLVITPHLNIQRMLIARSSKDLFLEVILGFWERDVWGRSFKDASRRGRGTSIKYASARWRQTSPTVKRKLNCAACRSLVLYYILGGWWITAIKTMLLWDDNSTGQGWGMTR